MSISWSCLLVKSGDAVLGEHVRRDHADGGGIPLNGWSSAQFDEFHHELQIVNNTRYFVNLDGGNSLVYSGGSA